MFLESFEYGVVVGYDGSAASTPLAAAAAQDLASAVLAPYRHRYPQVSVHTQVTGQTPVGALLEASDCALLLVISSYLGQRHVGGDPGAVARAVLGRACCPVVIVPTAGLTGAVMIGLAGGGLRRLPSRGGKLRAGPRDARMHGMTTLGAVFLPDLPPERLRAVARAADAAGLEELWLWEDCFRESGVASAAAALAWTQRLRIGIGLLPTPLRNVAVTAMEAATLHRLFPGRVRIGVGHGVQEWMGQAGARAESPMTLLREYLTALRALLGGERVSTDGRYVRLDQVALDWPPQPAPPVLCGATGPRTLRVSGAIADGTILTAGTPPDGVRQACLLVDEGRRSGNRGGPHPLIVFVHAATGADAAERLEAERQRNGYDSIRDLVVAGDARSAAEAVNRWAAAGASTVVLQPTPDDPDPEGFVRFVARDVRPLL